MNIRCCSCRPVYTYAGVKMELAQGTNANPTTYIWTIFVNASFRYWSQNIGHQCHHYPTSACIVGTSTLQAPISLFSIPMRVWFHAVLFTYKPLCSITLLTSECQYVVRDMRWYPEWSANSELTFSPNSEIACCMRLEDCIY